MAARSAGIVGVVTFLMILAIGTLLIWKSDFRYRSSGYKIISHFDDLGGLLKGADVRYRGFRVGRVSLVTPLPEQIVVEMWLDGDVKIPKNSSLKIYFDGLVGENYIGIIPNPKEKEFLKHNDVIQGETASDLANFIDIGSQNLIHAEAILNTLRKLITNEENTNSVTHTLKQFEHISVQLNQLITKLNQNTNAEDIQSSISQLNQLSIRINTASQKLFEDGQFIERLNAIALNLEKMSSSLANVTDQTTQQELKETVNNLNKFSARLAGKDRDSGNIIGALAAMDVSTRTSLRYASADDQAFYDADVYFDFGKYFLRAGMGDREDNTNQFLNLQHGIKVRDNLDTRMGLLYKKPGLGIDYHLTPKAQFSMDVYDPSAIKVDLLAQYALRYEMNLLMGIRHNKTDGKFNNMDFGVLYHF